MLESSLKIVLDVRLVVLGALVSTTPAGSPSLDQQSGIPGRTLLCQGAISKTEAIASFRAGPSSDFTGRR